MMLDALDGLDGHLPPVHLVRPLTTCHTHATRSRLHAHTDAQASRVLCSCAGHPCTDDRR